WSAVSGPDTEPPDPAPADRAGVPPATVPPAAVSPGAELPGGALPDGGWLPEATAQAVAAAAALGGWQRRRRHVPRPLTSVGRNAPDRPPLPATVPTVQPILYGREHPDEAPDSDTAAHGPTATAARTGGRATTMATTVAAIGPGDLPAGGVGLT